MTGELDAAGRARTGSTKPWWRDSIGYCLYLRSFADGNGDGIGDLWGVIDRLDHLEALGIDMVWITPFYPSPMADFGYDVADHCDVDPIFGDLQLVDRLIDAAHRRGISVIIDLVANHTSFDHPWFRSARMDVSNEHRDYYLWADPGPDGSLPNNWVSYFGGPAWTLDRASGQYYLHLFLPQQPDLNWRNPGVRSEFDRIIRFWLERGIDGFRVDVAQGLVKAEGLPSNPQRTSVETRASRQEAWAAFDHRYDVLQPASLDIFAGWKRTCDEYGAVLIGEVSVPDPEAFASTIDTKGLDVALWLEPLHVPWDADELQAVLRGPIDRTVDPHAIGWLGSSLDETRAVTRFGGGQLGRQRALALATMLVFLPGIPFLYQGEELGLEQSSVPADLRADPVGDVVESSRDGCRTPMPWSAGPGFGFTEHDSTWLPFGHHVEADTVAAQQGSPGSWFERYRHLISAWHELDGLNGSPVDWLSFDEGDLIGFRRGVVAVVLNTGSRRLELPLTGEVLYRTWGDGSGKPQHNAHSEDEDVVLPGQNAMVIRLDKVGSCTPRAAPV